MQSPKISLTDFDMRRVIGEGSYSTVYLAHSKQSSFRSKEYPDASLLISKTNDTIQISNGTQSLGVDGNTRHSSTHATNPKIETSTQEFAIKVLNKKHILKHKKAKYVTIEKDILYKLKHPFIIKLFYTFQDATNLYFVLEYVRNGDLLGVMRRYGRLSIEATKFFGAQIIIALEYIHAEGIIHRDLKPENILVDEKLNIKVTDFGTAKIIANDSVDPSSPLNESNESAKRASFVGTAEYCSPELLNDRQASAFSDIWAFGCIIFFMINGRVPFKAGNDYQTFQLILNGQFEFETDVCDDLRTLIRQILVIHPPDRLSLPQIKEHCLFAENSWHLDRQPKCPLLAPEEETIEFPIDEQDSDEFETSTAHLSQLDFNLLTTQPSFRSISTETKLNDAQQQENASLPSFIENPVSPASLNPPNSIESTELSNPFLATLSKKEPSLVDSSLHKSIGYALLHSEINLQFCLHMKQKHLLSSTKVIVVVSDSRFLLFDLSFALLYEHLRHSQSIKATRKSKSTLNINFEDGSKMKLKAFSEFHVEQLESILMTKTNVSSL